MGFNSAFKGLNMGTVIFVHKISVDIIKLVFSSGQWSTRCRACSFICVYSTVLVTKTLT